jgi:hypothetical protein
MEGSKGTSEICTGRQRTASHNHSQKQMHNFDEKSVYNVCMFEGEGAIANQFHGK